MPEPAHNASGSLTKTKVRASLLLMEWTAVDPHKPSVGRIAGCCLFPQHPKLMSECPRREKNDKN